MKQKMICIGMIGIFLLAGLTTISAAGKEITIHAFIDENKNEEFDQGEQSAAGALIIFYRLKPVMEIKIGGFPRFHKADSNGEAKFNVYIGSYWYARASLFSGGIYIGKIKDGLIINAGHVDYVDIPLRKII